MAGQETIPNLTGGCASSSDPDPSPSEFCPHDVDARAKQGGCASSSDPDPSASEFSPHDVDAKGKPEIEASEVHWSKLKRGSIEQDSSTDPSTSESDSDSDSEMKGSNAMKLVLEKIKKENLEDYQDFRDQWPGKKAEMSASVTFRDPDWDDEGFFKEWDDDIWVLSKEHFAKGAQAKLFYAWRKNPNGTFEDEDRFVVKVFKEGTSLRQLQLLWPDNMITSTQTRITGYFRCGNCCTPILGAWLLKSTGQILFKLHGYWGDLRTLIDRRMVHKNNKGPPFTDDVATWYMVSIARGLRDLHARNITHRDVKAANVLVGNCINSFKSKKFDPLSDDHSDMCHVADYEASGGIGGQGYWRAPEILSGAVDNDQFNPKLDVYSFGMTCYEILTSFIPLENLKCDDAVIKGERPKLPRHLKPGIKALLKRCWDHEPSKRPTFQEIEDTISEHLDETTPKLLPFIAPFYTPSKVDEVLYPERACLILSGARKLGIRHSNDECIWGWRGDENSLHWEIAVLKKVTCFDVSGEMKCSLPPGTYTLSWRILLQDDCDWGSDPAHFTLTKYRKVVDERKCFISRDPRQSRCAVEGFRLPIIHRVENGWMEYEVGNFTVVKGEVTCVLKYSMLSHLCSKSGICMDGVVIRLASTMQESVPASKSEHSTETELSRELSRELAYVKEMSARGGTCIVSGARELGILWSDHRTWWSGNLEHSLHSEVAIWQGGCWFEASGQMKCSLPPGVYSLSWRLLVGDDRSIWNSTLHCEAPHFVLTNKVDDERETFKSRCTFKSGRHAVKGFSQVENRWWEYKTGEFVVVGGEDISALKFTLKGNALWTCVDGVVIRLVDSSQDEVKYLGQESQISLGARTLRIIGGDNPSYWRWRSENSLQSEIVSLNKVTCFDVSGEMKCSLPPGTYTLSWRIHLQDDCDWGSDPVHFTLTMYNKVVDERKCFISRDPGQSSCAVERVRLPVIHHLKNGWMEYEVGEFNVVEGVDTLCLLKYAMVSHVGWKSGICMDGVVIRMVKITQESKLKSEAGHSQEAEHSGKGRKMVHHGVLYPERPSLILSGARKLGIRHSNDECLWSWCGDENSQHWEIAVLKKVTCFDVSGEMKCSLPPGAYTLSWRILLQDDCDWGLDPAHFTLTKYRKVVEERECFPSTDPPQTRSQPVEGFRLPMECGHVHFNLPEYRSDVVDERKCRMSADIALSNCPVEGFRLPIIHRVENGWMEYEAGEFTVVEGEDTCVLNYAMVSHAGLKSGVCMDGVVIRMANTIQESMPTSKAEHPIEHSREVSRERVYVKEMSAEGGTCIVSGARELGIQWSNNIHYCSWRSTEHSLHSEVAVWQDRCWFEASGQMKCSLPPGVYSLSWRLCLPDNFECSVWKSTLHCESAHFDLTNKVDDDRKAFNRTTFKCGRMQKEGFSDVENGWSEYKTGEFVVLGGDDISVLKFTLNTNACWTCVDGVVIRLANLSQEPMPISLPQCI